MEAQERTGPAGDARPAGVNPVETPHDPPRAPQTVPDLGTLDLFLRAGDYHQALAACEDMRAEAPYGDLSLDLALARRIAYCLEKLGRYQDVIDRLEPLLAAVPSAAALDSHACVDLTRCRLILGKTLLETGRMAEAEAQGHLALAALGTEASGPESGFVRNLLGTIRFRQGETEEARTHFRAALEHFRSRGDVTNLSLAYINLGHVYKQACEWARAEEHYRAAYYLRAAEGEFQGQGAILQNLALVRMKIGRYGEAREHLEESLRQALQQSDPARALRARLSLARLCRETWDSAGARELLRACREGAPDPMPEREACLVLYEEAVLARLAGRYGEAQTLAVEFADRVSRLAQRGDLAVMSLQLDGDLALDRHDWTDAEGFFRRARELAREDRDRYEESHALFGQFEVCVATGRLEEGEGLFQLLHDRLLLGGEQPGLARLYQLRGRLEQEARGRPEEALEWYRRARDLWRRMACPRLEAHLDLRMADALLDLGRAGEATTLIQGLRDRPAAASGESDGTVEALARVEARIREMMVRPDAVGLDGDHAFARIEDLLASDGGPGEKLRALLVVIQEALDAEGGLLARLELRDPDIRSEERTGGKAAGGSRVGAHQLEVLCTVSMGRLQGKRTFAPSQLGVEDPRRAAIVEPPAAAGRGEGAERIAALSWPIALYGQPHLVYVERRRGEAYGRAALDYGMALLAQAARGLRPILPVAGGDAGAVPAGGAARAGAARGRGRDGGNGGGVLPASRPAEDVLGNIHLADVITQNHQMLAILELIRKVSESDLTVLLQGETGTGKKLLAEVLHRTSSRRDRPFVTVDCAALPDSLLESELFGHRKGAFTGATADRVGLLEEGNGGTIFLDEIDKSGLSVQRRLLHMLDSGEVRPVGATGYKRLDVRVVCATSCPDLRHEVAAGRFLKDLFYRLNDISIVVPPLRERRDDIPLLGEWFIERFCRKLGRRLAGVSPSFHASLAAHDWPGNIRELEKAVRRAVTLAEEGATLVPDLLPTAVLESASAAPAEGETLADRIGRYERGLVLDALERLGWNKSRAALDLGLSRRGLKNKIERYKLDRRRTRRR